MSMYKVIARYCHIAKPGSAKGSDKLSWSIQGLIHKRDPQLPTLVAEIEAAKKNGFPSGFPAKGDTCLLDCAVEYPGSAALQDYMILKAKTSVDTGRKPHFVDINAQPLIDPMCDSNITGHYVYIDVGIATYNQASQGVKAYLNGVMDTGEMGPIALEHLSSVPSAHAMFSGVMSAPPSPPMVSPVGMMAPPAAPAPMAPPPAPPAAPVRTMTPKAAGATYESFISNGWNDAMLIEHGYMMPGF